MKIKEKEFLKAINYLIKHQPDHDLLISKITEEIGLFYNSDRVVFSKYDADNGIFIAPNDFYEYRKSEAVKSLIGISIESQGNIKYKNKLIEKKNVLYINDTLKSAIETIDENPSQLDHKNELDFLHFFNIKAAIGTTFLDGKELLGIMAIHFPASIPEPSEADINLIRNLSEIISPLFRKENKTDLLFSSFNQNIAKNLGLSAAILYDYLLKEDRKYTLFKKNDLKNILTISILDIKNATYLSNPEIRTALEKLYEQGIIELKKVKEENADTIKFLISPENKYINRINNENKLQLLFDNYIKCFQQSQNNTYQINDIISFKTFGFNFDLDVDFHKLIQYFFKSFIQNKTKEQSIGRELVSIIFQTLYIFINENDLTTANMIKLLEASEVNNTKDRNNITNLDKNIISSRFWLILIYRLSIADINSNDKEIYKKIMQRQTKELV
ncbi:MAG: GAF domain-containing protein [bacterium]